MGFTHRVREENQHGPERTSREDRSPGKCTRWSTRLVCGSCMGENCLGLVSVDQAPSSAGLLARSRTHRKFCSHTSQHNQLISVGLLF